MNRPLFVYGSMRDGDVLALVLGRNHPEIRIEPAWMPDAAVALVPGESYPYLVSAEGTRAPGAVIYGLDKGCLERVLFFEGDEYAFVECIVETAGGKRIAATHFGGIGIPKGPVVPWSLEQWQMREKARFLSMTREYMATWRRATRSEAEVLWQRLLREHSARDEEP